MKTAYLAILVITLSPCASRADDDMPGRPEAPSLRHHKALSGAFSPDGKVLVTAGADIRVWDAQGRRLVRTIALPDDRTDVFIRRLFFSADSKTLFAFADFRGSMLAFELSSGKLLARLPSDPDALHSTVAISPDGRTLAAGKFTLVDAATGEHKSELNLWDAAANKKLRTLPGHKRKASLEARFKDYLCIDSAVFSRDGKLLASAAGLQDDAVRVFDVATGVEKHALRRHSLIWMVPLVLSPEGHLAVVSEPPPSPQRIDSVITLWNMETGKIEREIANPPGPLFITFSPDGKWLAGLDRRLGVHVWNRATGELRFSSRPDGGGCPVAFSMDGNTLVAPRGTHVELFDLNKGRDVLLDK